MPRVQYSIQHPIETNNVNVNGTINLLKNCKDFKVKRFIYSSSSSVYGNQKILPLSEYMTPNPMSPYALQKFIGEYYCKLFNDLYDLDTISLRYFNVFGPRQNPEGDYACLIPKFIKLISENFRPKINGDGKQTRDFTFVSDVVEANVLAMNLKNYILGNFNIGNGKNISVNEVTQNILKLSNKKTEPIYGPAVIEPRNTLADISKAKEEFGWSPKTSFEEGLRETYQYFVNI